MEASFRHGPTMPDALTLIIPVPNGVDRLETTLRTWSEYLHSQATRESEIVVVDDGTTDGTAATLAALDLPNLRVLTHDRPRGFGACLRTALEHSTNPVVAYVGSGYPHVPSDLTKLLARLGAKAPVYDRELTIEAVSGCRTGRTAPPFWRLVGRAYRMFCRVALGVGGEPVPVWLGFREHCRSWFLWLAMGVPLHDVNSAFKVFRRSLFDRFPIQSDGEFVHAEIFAKLTFLTVLIDEQPLTPKPDAIPRSAWRDFWTVFTNAKFHSPLPDRTKPVGSGA
jgi:glycosyltransferase involved in cell wall biosynthesis